MKQFRHYLSLPIYCNRFIFKYFVTDKFLINALCLQQAYDQKNIRRRVYDALNVLMAMNIISKEKKEIKWIGLPTNSAQECQNLEVHVLGSFVFE